MQQTGKPRDMANPQLFTRCLRQNTYTVQVLFNGLDLPIFGADMSN